MSEFVFACDLADIPPDRPLAKVVGGVKLALVKDGEIVYAIADACSHADVALSEGEVSGCMLECWLHGSQFDLRTGRPTSLPAIEPVSIYATRISGDPSAQVVEVCLDPLTSEDISQRQAAIN
jgi:3-phenylpropionate/trans-cinnamate dioxygenase ferredoxin component